MSASGRARLMLGIIGLFLAGGLGLLTLFNSTKPRLMIVHALSQESTWTAGVDQGIRAALSRNRVPIGVTTDYLNLGLLSQGAAPATVAAAVRSRVDSIAPGVLIVVDDETSDLVGRYYARAGSRTSVVYTGLLAAPQSFGYTDASSAIGLRERLPLDALAGLITESQGGRPARIAIVGAATRTGLAEMDQARAHAWAPHSIVATESVEDFGAWKRFIGGLAGSADVLIALTMDNLARSASDERSVPEAQVAQWTEQNAVPLAIGVRQSFVRLGGALAVSSPPAEHGRVAVEMALARLADRRFTPPAGSTTLDAYDVSLRLSALERRGVSLPTIYREAARGAGLLYR